MEDSMNTTNCLEMMPISQITKYTKRQPGDGIPFTGYPRVHHCNKGKLILVNDPLGNEPNVLEFKLDDILFVEEIPSAVTEKGEGVPLVKLWVKKGSVGVILEPFEVNDPVHFAEKVQAVKARILQYNQEVNPVNKQKGFNNS